MPNRTFDQNCENRKYTFDSVINYVVGTAETFKALISFEIEQTDTLFSDGHIHNLALKRPPTHISEINRSHNTDNIHNPTTKIKLK